MFGLFGNETNLCGKFKIRGLSQKDSFGGFFILAVLLLPSLANAVEGVCDDCHTMHNSFDGYSGTPVKGLYTSNSSSCLGCHASGGNNDKLTGKGLTSVGNAPQVNSSLTPLAGGYFGNPLGDEYAHNVLGLYNADSNMLGNIPGGTLTYSQISCTGCHTGGHHGGTSPFRLLPGVTGGTPSAAYGVVASDNVFPGSRHTATYDATQMNLLCASCHGAFHGLNEGHQVGGTAWIRHPTDVSVNDSSHASLAEIVIPIVSTDAVVVGTAGTSTDVVMCLSCHVPHGGPYRDLLSFDYDGVLNGNSAGDDNKSTGCETCHSYNVKGM